LGARRPILALAPRGAVAELLHETQSGVVANPNDIASIKAAFVECYEKFGYRKQAFEPHEQAIRKYERRAITQQLAVLLDALQSRHSSPR
jgi:hypothetical protein